MTNVFDSVLTDLEARKSLTRQSHAWFFTTYFSKYIKYKSPEFHKDLFQITEDESIKTVVIVAFRGSAKSTIMSMSFPIWAMVGKLQKKHIIVIGLTQQQAKLILANIKYELENNELLINDFGPFVEKNEEWNSNSLVISNYQARIAASSSGEAIRGIRFLTERPSLIICDDVEDLESVKTQESRDRTYSWLMGEVTPLGDRNTKLVVIGNYLHEDSLIMRLKSQIQKSNNAIFHAYPLIDDNDNIYWPGKYPTKKDIEDEKSRVGLVAWNREYELKIIPDDDCVVRPEWIQYYEKLPSLNDSDFRLQIISVDLAISQKQTADYTAMISALIFGHGDELRMYVLPFPFNERINFPDTERKIIDLYQTARTEGKVIKIYIEAVSYQKALIQSLNVQGIDVEGVEVLGQDKKARLSQTTGWIKSGKILFPQNDVKRLINQIVRFGVEKHDDLADAFSMLVLQIMKTNKRKPRLWSMDSEVYRQFHDRFYQ